MMFHVYVEGPIDPSPDAHRRLAEIMANRYGLSVADVTARLAKGRFRVKANVDRATADVYVSDLGKVGAKVVIEEAGKPSSPSIPVPSRTATPASGLAAATGSTERPSRTSTPPSGLSAATTPPPNVTTPPFATGLAAALESQTTQDLGVLGGDSGAFALSSVDGKGHASDLDNPLPASFSPPLAAAAPRASAPKAAAAPASVRQQQDAAADMFAPPDAEDENQKMELAPDESSRQARRRANTPVAATPVVAAPVVAPVAATPVLQRKSSTPLPAAPAGTPVTALETPGRLGPLSNVRNRFAAGVIVAILLGFVPTHLIATFREHDAYAKIDAKYLVDVGDAPDMASWAALDEPALRDKKSAQHSIMLTSMLLWALFSAGLGYVWFRRIPWTKLDES